MPAASSPARAWTRSSSTTSRGPTSASTPAENEVTILTAPDGDGPVRERHVAKAGKEIVAAAILDAVGTLRDAH